MKDDILKPGTLVYVDGCGYGEVEDRHFGWAGGLEYLVKFEVFRGSDNDPLQWVVASEVQEVTKRR